MENNRNFTYCVPSVIEFIAQCYAMGTSRKIDNDQINFIKEAIDSTFGNTSHFVMDESYPNAMSAATKGALTAPYVLNHDFSFIKDNIINNKLPVMSIRFDFSSNFNTYDFTESHCRCVTGVGTTKQKIGKYFLWIKWTEWSNTNYYYLWDNTVDYKTASSFSIGPLADYRDKKNMHFWEKDQTWAYCGSFPIRYK